MGRKRLKSLGTGSVKNMDAFVQSHELLGRIEESIAAADYKKALRLFQNSIITILCNEGIMLVCSPYYWKGRKIKEKKVACELSGAYAYYCGTNRCLRTFKPYGNLCCCGRATVSFLGEVRRFLGILVKHPGQDPLEVFDRHMGSRYFDLEAYLDRADAYSFAHNRRSRELSWNNAVAPYAEKYYGSMDARDFMEFCQALDRIYTSFGFPFACTHSGWFFEGYDCLYQKLFKDGIYELHAFWENGQPDSRLRYLMEQYPQIGLSLDSLVEALLKPGYEPILQRLFPFRLAAGTLRCGCGMEEDKWESFIFKTAKLIYLAECCNVGKNVPGVADALKETAEDIAGILKTVRWYMDGKNLK